MPLRDLIEEYLALIDPAVDELGSRKAIDGVRKILTPAPAPTASSKSLKNQGDLKAVVDYMAKETAAGL